MVGKLNNKEGIWFEINLSYLQLNLNLYIIK